MTEQTPPPSQPTPPPAETPAGDGAAAGATPPPTTGSTPPPPPPVAPEDTVVEPAPEKDRNRTGLVIVAAGVVLVLVAAAAVVGFFALRKDSHKIVTPASAAGMKRDSAKEKEFKQQLDGAEKQFRTQAKGINYVKSAIYNQDDDKVGPQGSLVFIGAKLKKETDPAKFTTDTFSKQAGANGFKVTQLSLGDGAKGACAYQEAATQKIAICAWATKDTIGELIPTTPGWNSDKLGAVLKDLRTDVEKAE